MANEQLLKHPVKDMSKWKIGNVNIILMNLIEQNNKIIRVCKKKIQCIKIGKKKQKQNTNGVPARLSL